MKVLKVLMIAGALNFIVIGVEKVLSVYGCIYVVI